LTKYWSIFVCYRKI